MKEKLIDFKQKQSIRLLFSILCVIFSALLQTYALKVFLRPARLLSSGFTGLAILINVIGSQHQIQIPVALMIVLLNVPVAILCGKSISTKFTILSSLQFACVSIFLTVFQFDILFDDIMLNIVIGGAVYGLGIVAALVGNASTGGTDFIALYVSNKSGKTIWQQVFLFNTLLLVIFGALFGWRNAGYSIIFQYISTKVISTFHQRYHRVTLQITTRYGEDVMQSYLKNIRHGISCVDAIGGFSREKMYLLHTVISSYEVMDAVAVIKEADPRAIINQISTENFYGRFHREPE